MKKDDTNNLDRIKHPQEILLPGGKVGMVDIKPSSLLENSIPVFVGGGWGSRPEDYSEFIEGLVDSGRHTLSLYSIHGINPSKKLKQEVKDKNYSFPRGAMRKVAAILELMEKSKINKIDAIAHSECGIPMTIAALLHPEKFRSVTLVDSAGMMNYKRLMKFIKRYYLYSKREPAPNMDRILETILSRHTLAIAYSQATTYIGHWLKELKDKGVNILYVHSLGDKLYTTERLLGVEKTLEMEMVDELITIESVHSGISTDAKPYLVAINNYLKKLDKKL